MTSTAAKPRVQRQCATSFPIFEISASGARFLGVDRPANLEIGVRLRHRLALTLKSRGYSLDTARRDVLSSSNPPKGGIYAISPAARSNEASAIAGTTIQSPMRCTLALRLRRLQSSASVYSRSYLHPNFRRYVRADPLSNPELHPILGICWCGPNPGDTAVRFPRR